MYVSSVTVLGVISIHALREEGDDGNMDEFGHIGEFQSTPSARRATIPDREHTLLLHHFNPRPPRGGRPQAAVQPIRESLFQSTPSARRATAGANMSRVKHSISIHALREEGDYPHHRSASKAAYFNPRPPRGERRHPALLMYAELLFQSTPSARRATDTALSPPASPMIFQSTPSARRATAKAAKKSTTFVPLYTLMHNLKRNFTKVPAKCKTNRAKVSVFAVRSARGNHGSLCLAHRAGQKAPLR